MLQGRNLLRRRKTIRIKKRRNWRLLYFLIASFFLSILLIVAGYFINLYFPDILSPLARNRFNEISKIEKALSKTNIKFVKTTRQNDLSILVNLSDKEEVIFSSKKDLQSQIASLQLIVKRLTIEGKRFKRLDFRYDKPLIVF
jgi:hypothetical protein